MTCFDSIFCVKNIDLKKIDRFGSPIARAHPQWARDTSTGRASAHLATRPTPYGNVTCDGGQGQNVIVTASTPSSPRHAGRGGKTTSARVRPTKCIRRDCVLARSTMRRRRDSRRRRRRRRLTSAVTARRRSSPCRMSRANRCEDYNIIIIIVVGAVAVAAVTAVQRDRESVPYHNIVVE